MYIPKILAENAGIYRWNSVGYTMPGIWHQFLTFIFSLTWCTNWRLGLSPDNIAISMNNLSAIFVLIFGVAIIFQIVSLIDDNKKEENNTKDKESKLKKWENSTIASYEIKHTKWIIMWWTLLLLRLTSGMWAFLVIVDNKTDLWVMAFSLLALLAWLIFIQQNNKTEKNKKDLLKYLIITWLIFGFAALAKITAFVDLALFGLLLVWLRFSPIASLGLWITIMWLVRKFNVLTSAVMITDTNATRLIIIWISLAVMWLILWLLKVWKRKLAWSNFVNLVVLWISFLLPFLIFKLPRTIISSTKTDSFSVSNSLKSTFLWINSEKGENINNYKSLLTQSSLINPNFYSSTTNYEVSDSQTNQKSFSECTKIWDIYSKDELNENLQEIIGWWGWEDLWRYIWYGRKEFNKISIIEYAPTWTGEKNTLNLFRALWPTMTWNTLAKNLTEDQAISVMNRWLWTDESNIIFESNLLYWLLKKIWPTSESCYWFNHDAKILCNNAEVINNFKIDDLRAIYENWIKNKNWEAWLLLKKAIDAYEKAKSEWKVSLFTNNSSIFHDEIVNLRQYYQSHSISSNEDSINIPYRYLVPLNISFNWSLQNLSSYYTDIWFIWIIIYILLIISLPCAIIKKDKILTCFSLTTIIWRWIWWIIWSAILRYWTVLISWSFITLILFTERLFNNKFLKILPKILWIVIWLAFLTQIIFNFLRINSQWAFSIFVWYKWNEGKQQVISVNDNWEFNIKQKTKYWYSWKLAFNTQFAHYNPIINALANRKNEDWIIIAGTYIQYFLWNQWNIKSDWMLDNFRKKTSDWDLCKTYRRLRDDNTRYLIIDPNIWTVTMWEGNETLFYRFFGKLDNNKTKIEVDWTIITLIRLADAWYLKLINTNNIWSKYAFIIDNETLRNQFGWNLMDDDVTLTRSKMAVFQYFNSNSIFQIISNIFISRLTENPEAWIEDLANIYWLEVNSKNIAESASKFINWKITQKDIEKLNQDERSILMNYLNLKIMQKQNPNSFEDTINNILINNLFYNWSQIIALELN